MASCVYSGPNNRDVNRLVLIRARTKEEEEEEEERKRRGSSNGTKR